MNMIEALNAICLVMCTKCTHTWYPTKNNQVRILNRNNIECPECGNKFKVPMV